MAILKTPLAFLFIMLCLVGTINGYTSNLGHHAGNETKGNKKPLEHCALWFAYRTPDSSLVQLHCRSSSICSVVCIIYGRCSQVDNTLPISEECLLQSDKFRLNVYALRYFNKLNGLRHLKMLV